MSSGSQHDSGVNAMVLKQEQVDNNDEEEKGRNQDDNPYLPKKESEEETFPIEDDDERYEAQEVKDKNLENKEEGNDAALSKEQ